MNTISVKLCEIESRILPIGFEGEQNHTQVIFDCSPVFSSNPGASASMMIKSPTGNAYPKIVNRDGNNVVWVVSAGDCANDGSGRYQLTFTDGDEIIKSWDGGFIVNNSIKGSGVEPDPVKEWEEEAQEVLAGFTEMTASASSLPAGSEATAELTDVDGHKNLVFGIPVGEPGADGFSPTVTVTDITGGHRITITDATGAHSFDVMDGETPTVPVTDVQVNGTSVVNSGVANVPIANNTNPGVVKVHPGDKGLSVDSNNSIQINRASDSDIKAGTHQYRTIVPNNQHTSIFYGLSKLAGEDLKNDTVTVGTYPQKSKSAISQMLNGAVSVSGSTPSITALAGVRYICGEVSTLDITLPASGCIDVTFESGSTATVLTITPPTGVTVKWANGFDSTSLEANTTYELNIMDGLGVACSWT